MITHGDHEQSGKKRSKNKRYGGDRGGDKSFECSNVEIEECEKIGFAGTSHASRCRSDTASMASFSEVDCGDSEYRKKCDAENEKRGKRKLHACSVPYR